MNIQTSIPKSIGLAIAVLIGAFSNSSFAQTVAYTEATIITMGQDGQIDSGTLLVRDSKIVAVGKDVDIPSDARIVSLQGKTIMPGIIDPYYVFKTSPPPAPPQTSTTRGRGRGFGGGGSTFTVGSFTKVAENFYPYDVDFMPAIRSGITTAQLVSDGRGLSTFANLVPDPTPEMLLEEFEGFLFAKVTNQTSALDSIRKNLAGESERPSRGRGTSRGAITNRTRGGGGGQGGTPPPADTQQLTQTSDDKKTEAEKKEIDPIKAMWNAVREGKKPLVVNANNAATVAYLNKMLQEFDKVKLHLVATGPNLFQSLDEIAKSKNVTLVMQPGIDTVPYSSQFMNVPLMAHNRKIQFALSLSLNSSQMQGSQDDPLFPVATLVKSGLPPETALQALTTTPAKILGIDKTHGSLEKDKAANFLVFDGDPLTAGSRLKQVFSKGKSVYEN
jgi:imidazolonepropionase-like amidohydrolase